MSTAPELDRKDDLPTNDSTNGRSSLSLGFDDVAIIPKGVLDPVYEAKARVLNRAVRNPSSRMVLIDTRCGKSRCS